MHWFLLCGFVLVFMLGFVFFVLLFVCRYWLSCFILIAGKLQNHAPCRHWIEKTENNFFSHGFLEVDGINSMSHVHHVVLFAHLALPSH